MRIEIEKHEALTALFEQNIDKISLFNNNGMSIEILTYGCLMLSINVPDYLGYVQNVLMTYDALDQFAQNPLVLNTTIGLNAGRLKDGRIKVGNKEYKTEINNGISNLHGGSKGLHKQFWTLGNEDIYMDHCEVSLKYTHEHESDGFPGNIEIEAVYALYDDNRLVITFNAISDRACHINMTNHNYFNLSGDEKRKIDEHLLFVNASYYMEIDKFGLPLPDKVPTKNSVFDFSQLVPISSAFKSEIGGIDHPFSIEDKLEFDKPSVVYHDPISRRTMQINTNQPSVVIYTNNVDYKNHNGICFEAQQFPNTPNIIEGGEKYQNETSYLFLIKS